MLTKQSTAGVIRRFAVEFAWFSIALVWLAGCSRPQPGPAEAAQRLTIFAAASATEAIEQLTAKFEQTGPPPPRTSFAASSTLAQQIIAGAPADIFLSASESWADAVEEKGLVIRRRDLLSNRLVIVVPLDATVDVDGLDDLATADVKRIALADEAVPAGQYARQALANSNLWDAVRPRVVGGADVRQTLLFVERREADAGIVYATDARGSDKVRVVAEIDPSLHAPIRYPLLLLKQTQENPAAQQFFDLASGPVGAEVFRGLGFTLVERPPAARARDEPSQ